MPRAPEYLVLRQILDKLRSTFKTNPYMERALMTGITRVSKESIFSDFNNPKVVTTTSKEYADCFGFTEEEVFAALEEYDLSEKKEEVKTWYDGFTFGDRRDIYNPWSIVNNLDTGEVAAYWTNSSSNRLAGKLIREGSKTIKQDFEQLLRGECLEAEIDEQIAYGSLSEKKNAVWSLLLATGYLKAEKREYYEATGDYRYTLALTNREVKRMFEHMVLDWFKEDAEDEADLEETAAAALSQIEEKQYAAALMARGIPQERIRSYGCAFEGKTVLIRSHGG